MTLLIVNYHYIGSTGTSTGQGIHPVSVSTFRHQIEEISKHFSFISQEDISLAVEKKKKLPEMACLITFDDGLRCQYELALPILDDLNVPAIFFINTLPYTEERACFPHILQYLRSVIPPEELLKNISEEYKVTTKNTLPLLPEYREGATRQYKHDSKEVAHLKYLMNHVLDVELSNKIVKKLLFSLISSEKHFCDNLYMAQDHIRQLGDRRYLGLHSHKHRPLSRMGPREILEDLVVNQQVLMEMSGINAIQAISYPFGSQEAVSLPVIDAAKEIGCVWGVTMERAFNQTLDHPLLLGRLDTNDVIGGKSPKFDFSMGLLTIKNGVTKSREVFCRDLTQ